MLFSKILVSVDLTEKGNRAVEVAGDLVAAGGSVVLLHVIEAVDAPLEKMTDFYASLQAEAQTRIEEHVGRLSQNGVNASGTIRVGNRAREITRFSQENDFDLMILYSHRLDPADLMHGLMTISHQVAIAAPCAVLLLRRLRAGPGRKRSVAQIWAPSMPPVERLLLAAAIRGR